MKKLISFVLAISMLMSATAYADCDFKTGITSNDNGTYTYTRDCHLKVGEMKQSLLLSQQQVAELNKAMDLKDLALTKANERADLWMNTTFKLEDRVMAIDKMENTNKWLYFGLGVLTTFAAAYAARQTFGR